jgi:hypothetical protein
MLTGGKTPASRLTNVETNERRAGQDLPVAHAYAGPRFSATYEREVPRA